MMSNELDILLVGFSEERFQKDIRLAFRHWQVYSAAAPHALYGRKMRRAYYTTGALTHPNGEALLNYLRGIGVEIIGFSEFRPEFDVQTLEDARTLRDLRRSRHPAV